MITLQICDKCGCTEHVFVDDAGGQDSLDTVEEHHVICSRCLFTTMQELRYKLNQLEALERGSRNPLTVCRN